MEFLDRIDERRRLEKFLAQGEGAMACVCGRRRIGKSRLLDESEPLYGRCRPMELDVVAESVDGKSLLVGECKLALSSAEAARAVSDLADKAAHLPFADKYKRIETRLFVAQKPPRNAVSIVW